MKKFIILLIIGFLICPINSYADNTTSKTFEKLQDGQKTNIDTPVLIDDLADKIGKVGDIIMLNASATVSDGGELSYKWFEVGGKDKRKPSPLGVTEPCYFVDTSIAGTRYYYCQITNTKSDPNGYLNTMIIESSVAKVTIKNSNSKPVRKSGVSYQKNYTVEFNKTFQLDLSTIFEDPDNDDLTFLYKKTHNDTTIRDLETNNNFSYKPEDLNNVTFEFNAFDGIVHSLDGYQVNLTVKGVEVTGYDPIADVSAGKVDNLSYANADEVIQALPDEVTILGTNDEVPIISWENTDNYRNEAGSYTFTAQLGELPLGYVDNETNQATVEVIVSENIPKYAETPTIENDLVDQTCDIGDNIILDATATVSDGGEIIYEWYEITDINKLISTKLNVTTPTYTVDTSAEGVRCYYCEVTNINVKASHNKVARIHSNTVIINVKGENHKPIIKPEISSHTENCTIVFNQEYTLDLSTIFEDPDGDKLNYYYDIIHDGIILQKIETQKKFTYEPEDLNDVELIFVANDGELSSSDFYIVNLSVKGIEIKGYEPIKDISAGEVNNLIYTNANEVMNILPKTANIVGTNKIVQITSWEDTDNYRNKVGSYTFTAQIDTLPYGYIDFIENKLTVEVIVVEETKIDAELPNIINDLTDQYCEKGDFLVLDASATVSDGGELSYKWYEVADKDKSNPILLDVITPIYTVDTSSREIRYYFCEVTNINNNVNGNKIVEVCSNVSQVTVGGENLRPRLKFGLSNNVNCSISYSDLYTLDLSTIFQDPDDSELYYYYEITHNGITKQHIKTQRNFSYEPEDLNDVTLKFNAYDGELSSTDSYTVNLKVKGIEILGYEYITSIYAGKVNNLVYKDANEVIKNLPKVVEITGVYKEVDVLSWEDTDNYKNEVGSYTFTAQLGELPLGYVDDEVNKVTIEAIVFEETIVDAEIPTIINDLTDHNCRDGDTIILDATATVNDGGQLSYRWYEVSNKNKANPVFLNAITPTYRVDTSNIGVKYCFCEIKNTNNKVNGNKVMTVCTNVSEIAIAGENLRPRLRFGISKNVDCEISYNDIYTLDLSTIFIDDNNQELYYNYEITHNGVTKEHSYMQKDYTYKPTDLNDVILKFSATDGVLTSTDKYTVNLKINGVEIQGYEYMDNLCAGKVNNLIYKNANAVIKDLPKTVKIKGTNKNVNILSWEDTDNYRNEEGSYTFTAQLGELPLGYVDDKVNQVTVEVVVLEETKVDAEIPTIINNLVYQTCEVGDNVVLDATSKVNDGGQLSYKWFKIINIKNTCPPILLDVTTPTYKVDTSVEGEIYYFCRITNTNNKASGKTEAVTSTNVISVTVKKEEISEPSNYVITPLTPTKKAYNRISRAKPDKNGIIKVKVDVESDVKGRTFFKLPSNFLNNNLPVHLTIKNNNFEITLLNKMFNKKYKTVELVIEPSDINKLKLSDDEKEKMKDAKFYNIYFKINGKKVNWIGDKDIQISIAYNLVNLEEQHNVVAAYYDKNSSKHIIKTSYYYDGKVYYKTKQLGIFGLSKIDSPFKDIEKNWAKKSIEALYARGVINGIKIDEFKPERSIKRANFIVLMVKCFDLTSINTDSFNNESPKSFDDVDSNEYYAKAIAIAKDIGLTNGCGNNKFKPLNPISREDMMVLLQRVIKITGKYPNIKLRDNIELNFSDIDDIESYALESLKLMISNELIKIELDKICPKDSATRADVVYALYNILKTNMK